MTSALPLDALHTLIAAGDVVVLCGAGLSTESGIPDYRGPSGALRTQLPMTYQSFVRDPVARHRYWARSYLGWPQIAAAQPNAGHRAVAALHESGALTGIITQNVDGLQQAAGVAELIELHGGLARTVCLRCGDRGSRADLDRRLRAANPGFEAAAGAANPDGDVELPDAALAGFVMLDCPACGTGLLKPDVVFFGEGVPRERVARSFALLEAARVLLVLGSSLSVLSGYRFVRRAAQLGTPVAIVNQGTTRGDPQATLRIDAPLGEVLPALAAAVVAGQASSL